LPAQSAPDVLPIYLNTIDCLRYAHYIECSVVPYLTLSVDGQYLQEHRQRSISTPATPIKLAETVTLLSNYYYGDSRSRSRPEHRLP